MPIVRLPLQRDLRHVAGSFWVPLHKWWIAAGMIVDYHKCAATNFSGV